MSLPSTQVEELIVKSSISCPEVPSVSVPHLLAQRISTFDQDLLAVIDPLNGERSLNYGQLHARAQSFASSLLRLGATSDDSVLLFAENSTEHLIASLGVIYLGLPFTPLPPACGAHELTLQLTGSRATILIFGTEKLPIIQMACTAQPQYTAAMEALKIVIQLDAGTDEPVGDLEQCLPSKETRVSTFSRILPSGDNPLNAPTLKSIPHFPIANLETTFLLCFTSGTTGAPKGAVHTHRSFVNTIVNASQAKGASPVKPTIIWHPLGHISGNFLTETTLYRGSPVILLPNSDVELILRLVEKYALEHFLVGAGQISQMLSQDYTKRYNLSSLRAVVHVGAPIGTALLLRLRAEYQIATINAYGSTEFLGSVSGFGGLETDTLRPGCVGQLKAGVELKIRDLATGATLPANEDGEICLRGPCCFSGYLDNPQATAETLVNGWYHSGDVGHYDTEGNLYITDRIKELFKYQMYPIVPTEIEDVLHAHQAVEAVCVVGVPHATDTFHVRAYVQLTEAGKATEEKTLMEHVARHMGAQKRLRGGVVWVETMPRTVIGKVDRQYFKRLVSKELLTEIVP